MLLLTIGAAAAAVHWTATHFGIGLSSDSVKYIRYAKTILGTEEQMPTGLVRDYLVHYPPLYPAALAAINCLGLDIYTAARLLQTLLLAANVMVAGWLVYATTASIGAAAAAALGMAIAPPLTTVHLWAWSEPLFLLLVFASLASMMRAALFLRKRWVVCAGAFTAMAVLTRYAGIALVPCGAVVLYAIGRWRSDIRLPNSRKALRRVAVFLAVSLIPLAAWLVRNRMVAGKTTNRVWGYHAVLGDRFSEAGNSVAAWFAPGPDLASTLAGAAVAVLFMGVFLWAMMDRLQTRGTPAPPESHASVRYRVWLTVSAVFTVCYTALLVFSIALADPLTPMDDRILSPVVAVLIVSFVSALQHRLQPDRGGIAT